MSTGLGDAASSVVQQFDLTQYVPADIQNDYSTGAAYFNEFKGAAQHVTLGPNGSVQIDDKTANTLCDTALATVEAAVPVMGPALAVFMALAPKAGSGPGTCVTNPPVVADPAHPKPSEILGWQFYTPWSKFFEAYNVGSPNSFERYANTALQWNWELSANCFSNLYAPSPVLLAALIASWNATHAGPHRTVTRSGLNPSSAWGLPQGFDPIAEALTGSVFGSTSAAGQDPPIDFSSSFVINDGPEISAPVAPKVIHFRLRASSVSSSGPVTPAPPSSGLSTGGKVALSLAIVGGTAAAGVGVWAHMTHQSYGQAWSRVWKKSGGKLLRNG